MKWNTDFLGRPLQFENSMTWKEYSFSPPWCPTGVFNQQCQRGKLSDNPSSSCIFATHVPTSASASSSSYLLEAMSSSSSNPTVTHQLLLQWTVYCTLQCIQKSASIFKGKDDKLNVEQLLVLWINYVSRAEWEQTQCRLLLYHLPWSDNDSH